jgi:hypothetical protein
VQTLLLDVTTWDLVLDANGNIAIASDPYSLAQDAASAIRLFIGELWYDTSQGVPYWQDILGKAPPLSLVRSLFITAALTVPGVASAKVFFSSFSQRSLSGQVQITSSNGQTAAASFAFGAPG